MTANLPNDAHPAVVLGRRRFLKATAAGAALAWFALHIPKTMAPAIATRHAPAPVVIAQGGEINVRLRSALAHVGGLSMLARHGEIVAIKPTLAWNRAPDFAANTSPEMLRAVVALALEAGAAEVRVFDRASFKPEVCYRVAGARAALAGFDPRHVRLLPLTAADFLPVAPAGGIAPRWQVCRHVLEADRLINLPVVKQHPARGVSLGLPNLLGAVGGPPAPDAANSELFIAEVAGLLRPDLTILDAQRVLVANGPMGRSRADVRQLDTLVLGTDPLAVDLVGTRLFNLPWREIAYLRAAIASSQWPVDPDQLQVVHL